MDVYVFAGLLVVAAAFVFGISQPEDKGEPLAAGVRGIVWAILAAGGVFFLGGLLDLIF